MENQGREGRMLAMTDKDLGTPSEASGGAPRQFASTGGRRSGKNEAMRQALLRAKPGNYAIVGPNDVREIVVMGDAVIVDEAPPLLPAPTSERSELPEPASGGGSK